MDWILFWQIAGSIIALLGIIIMVVLFLWPRREKVSIKVTGINYQVHGVDKKIQVYLGIELQRSGRKEVRYVKQILLKPDKHIYKQLCYYFKLPDDGLILINEQIKLPRDYKATFARTGSAAPNYPVYPALPELPRDTQQRDSAQKVADELGKKTHKVGLGWDDSNKITWKTINARDHGEWVE